MKINLSDLEKNLGCQFKDNQILLQALIHRSYLNEDANFKFSNERLEFLGDSVLSLATSSYIYELYPNFPEGKLTATRSLLVQAKTLAKAAVELELGKHLLMSRGEEQSGGRQNISLLADAFEAVIGAIFIDQGFTQAEIFIKKTLLIKIDEILTSEEVFDFKSVLQEKVQETKKLSPSYQVIKSEGPDHAKIFYVEVQVSGQVFGSGSGKSKQVAEQMAAKDALEKLR